MNIVDDAVFMPTIEFVETELSKRYINMFSKKHNKMECCEDPLILIKLAYILNKVPYYYVDYDNELIHTSITWRIPNNKEMFFDDSIFSIIFPNPRF